MPAHRKYDYTPERLLAAAKSVDSITALAKALEIEQTSLSGHLRRNPDLRDRVLQALGRGPQEGERVVDLEDADVGDVALLFGERGIDVTQWRVTGISATRWAEATCPECDHHIDGLRRLKANIVPRGDVLLPARKEGPRWKWPKDAKLKPGSRVAFVADPHAPYEDRRALAAFRRWLDKIGGVDQVVILGDVLDLPTLSRWPQQPGQPDGNACLEAGYEWLRELRDMAPDTPMTWLVGNHDVRIDNYARDKAPGLMELRQRGVGERLLGLAHALSLDELAIDLVSPREGWEVAELQLTPELAAWHAPPSKQQRDALMYSVVHAHHHRTTWQSTPQLAPGNQTVGRKQVVGVPSMARVQTGMGYAKATPWNQGWAWADLWEGCHEINPVTYHDGMAWWARDRVKVQ